VVLAVLVAACGSSTAAPPSSTGHPVLPTTSWVRATTPATVAVATPAPTSSPSTSSATSAAAASAKQQWVEGATAISADLNRYLLRAASDLSGAVSAGDVNASGNQVAVQELRQLASIPETSDTPEQLAEAHSDIQALNSFFGTPGLYN
jgi:hypothetical protein